MNFMEIFGFIVVLASTIIITGAYATIFNVVFELMEEDDPIVLKGLIYTTSIVTLIFVGCMWLFVFWRAKALWF